MGKTFDGVVCVVAYVTAFVNFIIGTNEHSAYRMATACFMYLVATNFERDYDDACERERTTRTDFRTFR